MKDMSITVSYQKKLLDLLDKVSGHCKAYRLIHNLPDNGTSCSSGIHILKEVLIHGPSQISSKNIVQIESTIENIKASFDSYNRVRGAFFSPVYFDFFNYADEAFIRHAIKLFTAK